MHLHLGIDVSKKTLDCALRLENGKFKHKKVANDEQGFQALSAWLKDFTDQPVHVCMEATGVYWEKSAEYFADENCAVSVINPLQIKKYGESKMTRTKTDKNDAKLIALFCQEQKPATWVAPAPAERVVRALVLRVESLQAMHTQETNRIDVSSDTVKPGIQNHIDWLAQEIKEMKKKIKDHIDNDPDLKSKRDLLATIPGVGEVTIANLLAYSMHPERFANARKATAFAGLDPRIRESGSSVKDKPRISKVGHAHLRKVLYMPAIATLSKTAWGKDFKARLEANGKRGRIIICAMMRKLVHVAFGVLKTGKPFDPALHISTAA